MTSKEIREQFLKFFENKQHSIVPSAPMVIKDDSTLMFTNAGMNQFKDVFLGNKEPKSNRLSDSQKCLRVSGKHNDLDEVGYDTYHHTMFEMLGNWSFGDYFKKEAIDWAWELLTDVLKIEKENLYVTVFGGDEKDGVGLDKEAKNYWLQHVPEERILLGNKKDNFWEMGEQGPCGPCSEIHIDIRDQKDKDKLPGAELVNMDHPLVIEIWNLVFIEFNRKANGSLETLPAKHVDTGMGFERLAMVLQNKQSNYDTDVFQPLIHRIMGLAGKAYGQDEKADIAMRVIADHTRAISFAIADGQLPSNNKAGYVIRRILRRAVRYGYTFLGFEKPFIHEIVSVLVNQMGEAYPELVRNQELITNVIREEEASFLRTLETGLKMLQKIVDDLKKKDYKVVNGKEAFELYDTFGFPLDLTELILKENDMTVSKREFDEEMEKQKNRSRKDADKATSDWTQLREDDVEEFVGYDHLETEVQITQYRVIKQKNKEQYQLVFNITPFYPEGGGQVGDTGYIQAGEKKISILNTLKENNQIIHIAKSLPENLEATFKAVINVANRQKTTYNHSATHLLHNVLRDVLGTHVEQKGSLVNPDYLRFDFSHFQKLSKEEILDVEAKVNALIRSNNTCDIAQNVTMKQAVNMGAMALFGEKYGDVVRVVKFGDSVELCGGTHVEASGNIGMFKITSEGSIAAGIRRIEAVTAEKAESFVQGKLEIMEQLTERMKNQKDLVKGVDQLLAQNKELSRKLESQSQLLVNAAATKALSEAKEVNGVKLIVGDYREFDTEALKMMAFQLAKEENTLAVLTTVAGPKVTLMVAVAKNLIEEKGLSAGTMIRELSKEIQGGGGGQAHFATAGGKNADGIQAAFNKVESLLV